MTKKVVKYEGFLDYEELKSFTKNCYMFLVPGNPMELSINSPEDDSGLWQVIISSDLEKYLPVGIFLKCDGWYKKFHRVSDPLM